MRLALVALVALLPACSWLRPPPVCECKMPSPPAELLRVPPPLPPLPIDLPVKKE